MSENVIKLYESSGVTIQIDKISKRIDELYIDFVADDDIISFKKAQIEAIAENGVISLVSDMRGFQGASPTVVEWVGNVWFNLIFEAGIKNIAMVVPEDIFAQFSLEAALGNEIVSKQNTEKFSNLESAYEWCRQFVK